MEKKKTTKKVTAKAKPEKKEKVTKSKKANSSITLPSYEEIRAKAEEIYYKRIERGESGNQESDWLEAERVLLAKQS